MSYHIIMSHFLCALLHMSKSMNAISRMPTFSSTTRASDLPYVANTLTAYLQRIQPVCLCGPRLDSLGNLICERYCFQR